MMWKNKFILKHKKICIPIVIKGSQNHVSSFSWPQVLT